jgi:hypothetical protein
MKTSRKSYQELHETLTLQTKSYTVANLKQSIVAMKVIKFLMEDAFMFIVTLTPFIVLMWLYNFSIFMSTVALITHAIYWFKVVKKYSKNDGMKEHIEEVGDMITIYREILTQRSK